MLCCARATGGSSELGLSDDQVVGCDVIDAYRQGLEYPHARRGQQAEQCCVCQRPDRTGGEQGGGGTEQPDDLIRRIDMGCSAPNVACPSARGMHLVADILST